MRIGEGLQRQDRDFTHAGEGPVVGEQFTEVIHRVFTAPQFPA